jgi:hypothetical protein
MYKEYIGKHGIAPDVLFSWINEQKEFHVSITPPFRNISTLRALWKQYVPEFLLLTTKVLSGNYGHHVSITRAKNMQFVLFDSELDGPAIIANAKQYQQHSQRYNIQGVFRVMPGIRPPSNEPIHVIYLTDSE